MRVVCSHEANQEKGLEFVSHLSPDKFVDLQKRFLVGTLAIDPEGPYPNEDALWDGEF